MYLVFKTRDGTVMTSLYKSLVRSTLEYCCPLWNPGKETDIHQKEGVQKTFTSRKSIKRSASQLLGKACMSQANVTAAQAGEVYHLDDVEDSSKYCPKLLPLRIQNDIKTLHYSCHPSAELAKSSSSSN